MTADLFDGLTDARTWPEAAVKVAVILLLAVIAWRVLD